ncbi:hypothetical protein HAALTHF_10530n [Vreelandella aquamarina]|nr:hypothetical protein HAALTHF_10530n [Halomonas axialensis]
MHDAAASGHPLHAACVNYALVLGAVGMGQRALQNEGDRLESPVRVRPKGQPLVVGGYTCGPWWFKNRNGSS